MNTTYRVAAIIFYILLFIFLYPLYQYVIDIDAISYFHVAERIAQGKYYHSINGYWSPLISWILVPFLKMGLNEMITAKYLNGVFGLLSLLLCFPLLDTFKVHRFVNRIIPFILAILFVSYCFYELCADLLQVLLLLGYLNLIFKKDFITNNKLIILSGIIGGVAYFAKAYNFPLFILHFSITLFLFAKKRFPENYKLIFLKKLGIGFLAFFITTAPYIALLTHKYGSVRISNAGKLNRSWFLERTISDTRRITTPPPFEDATSVWDEPTYAQEKYFTPFTSIQHFKTQIKIVISTCIRYLSSLSTMSIFAFLILTAFLIHLLIQKQEADIREWVLYITTLIYPIGYLTIFVEWRYLWLLPITLLLLMAILLTTWQKKYNLSKKIFLPIIWIGCLSFTLQPINELQDLSNHNKDVFEIAEVFKKNNIKGNYLVQYKTFEPFAKAMVLSYLTNSKLYGPNVLDYTITEYLDAVKQHKIDYSLYFYDHLFEKEIFLHSPYATSGKEIMPDLYPGLIVIKYKE